MLATAVPRGGMHAVVAACDLGERRRSGKLPAHVVAYVTMGLCLFRDDDYEEVATKVGGVDQVELLGRGVVGADRGWDQRPVSGWAGACWPTNVGVDRRSTLRSLFVLDPSHWVTAGR